MKAVAWHGKQDVRVDNVPDPRIEEPNDAIVRITTTNIAPGDRVVLPFNISCGHCFMCDQRLYSQCETTQVHEYGTGAKFFGYTKLYGQVPGGQVEYLRVPQAQFVPIKVPEEGAGMS